MPLPLTLLKAAQNHPMQLELKNGASYNGHLVGVDGWMNVHIKDVIITSKDGDRFFKSDECYIRGNTIKSIRLPEEVLGLVREDEQRALQPAQRGKKRQRKEITQKGQ